MDVAGDLRNIARGFTAPRGLSQTAARSLMGEVLDGHASTVQVGAFLMAMRLKGETLDELSGFLEAAQQRCLTVPSDQPVVLIPSYRGSRKQPNLTPLLALWLARQGVRVLMHGPLADPERVTSAEVLQDLGVAPALQSLDVDRAWERREPAFVPTRVLCPPLQALLDLRRQLGVHGPGHAVARLLNPVQGAPALRTLCLGLPQSHALLGTWVQHARADAVLLRGTEGEPVADPRRQPHIQTWLEGRLRPELCLLEPEGGGNELPLLPRETDAASTALYAQEVLSGMRPVPTTMARQSSLIVAAVAQLRGRSAAARPRRA